LGRQSYFVNPCFPRFKHPSGARETDDLPGSPCSIRRSGQINGLATGAEAHVVGAWRRDTGELTEYSSAGETTGPPRKPDVVLVGDDSRVHFGVLAAGSRSGGAVPMNGTSVAAPALTRKIADLLANGDQTTRLDIQGLADPGPPPLPDNRAGAGRINHDPVRDAKRRET
jgi:hypothetical protein